MKSDRIAPSGMTIALVSAVAFTALSGCDPRPKPAAPKTAALARAAASPVAINGGNIDSADAMPENRDATASRPSVIRSADGSRAK